MKESTKFKDKDRKRKIQSQHNESKDEERLLKMYEHVGKAYSDWSERETNGRLWHHKIITTTTENKD